MKKKSSRNREAMVEDSIIKLCMKIENRPTGKRPRSRPVNTWNDTEARKEGYAKNSKSNTYHLEEGISKKKVKN